MNNQFGNSPVMPTPPAGMQPVQPAVAPGAVPTPPTPPTPPPAPPAQPLAQPSQVAPQTPPAEQNQQANVSQTDPASGSVPEWQQQPEVHAEKQNDGGGAAGWIKGTLVALVIVIGLVIFAGIGGGALAMSGVVDVPDDLQLMVLDVWMSIPWVPKPPELVLAQAAVSMAEVEQLDLNLSLAFKSQSLAAMLGSADFDLVVSGPVNFENNDSPEMALSLKTNNQIDADVVVKDDVYFRINQIPQTILGAMMGLSDSDSEEVKGLLGTWVRYERSEVESTARDSLNQQTVANDPSEEMSEKMQILLEEKIAPLLESENTKLDERDVVRVSAMLEGQVINDLVSALREDEVETRQAVDEESILPADVIKRISVELWVDTDEFYVRKVSMYVLVDNEKIVDSWGGDELGMMVPMEQETFEMVLVAEMDNFGQASVVMIPAEYVELEDYTASVMKVVMGSYEEELVAAQEEQRQVLAESGYTEEEIEEFFGGAVTATESASLELPSDAAWGSQVLGIWTEENEIVR